MKRILLIAILVVSLLTATLVPMSAMASDSDISSDTYLKACDTLARLGMLGDDFVSGEKIKFGEFLGLAMKLTGVEDGASSSPSPYSDVSPDDRYFNAVCAATNLGVVSGWGDGTLGYGDNISMDRAAKILVSILGYDPRAMVKGGYPAGYAIVAGSIGATDDITYNAGESLTWDQAAQLVYNCLEIEILQPESYPAESYITVDGETPLTKWMKIEKTEGTVTGNALTTITGEEPLENGVVTIDGERYAENGTVASQYIGCKITAYYREETSAKRTLLMISLDESAKVWEIPGEDIDDTTTKDKVCYYTDDSDKIKTIAIESDANIFFNFKKYSQEPTDSFLKPSNGAVRLVDSDGNNKADSVYVTESTTYVVEEVRAANGYIADLYNQPDLRLDNSINDDLVFEVIKDGVVHSLEDIKVNDVLTVTKSEDGNYIKLEIGYKRAKGTLEGMGDDYLEIKGGKYGFVKQNKDVFTSSLLGKEITVLFDKYLNAAGYIISLSDDLNYGYLAQVKSSGKGLEAGAYAQLMIFTPNGEFVTLPTAEKVSLNGATKNSAGESFDGQKIADKFTKAVDVEVEEDVFKSYAGCDHQLIKYKLNDAGQITEVETARNNCFDRGGTGMEEEGFTLDLDYVGYGKNPGGAEHNFIYKNSGLLGNDYDLKNTVGIQIPNEVLWNNYFAGLTSWSDLEKAFSIYSPYGDWPNDKRFTDGSKLKLYDIDSQKVAKFAVTEGESGSVNPGPALMLVESIVQALDEDGMPGTKINGFYKGKQDGFFVKTDASNFVNDPKLLELNSGDIIRVALDATGKVVNLFKVYTLHQDAEWDDAKFGKNADKRNISFPDTIRPNREYLLGGDEFAEWTFSNGETGDPNVLRTYPYCFWTGNINIVMHVRSVYMSGSRAMLNHGFIAGSGEEITEKLINVPSGVGKGFYLYDEATETGRIATTDDLIKDDRYTYVLRSRYGTFDDLIVIKHKEAVLGYWEGYTEGK